MFGVGGIIGELDGLLRVFWFDLRRVFPLIDCQNVPSEAKGRRHEHKHLQYRSCHARFLSTSMPSQSKMAPTKNTKRKASQRCLFGSKSSYMGANTNTRIPASRRASPPISAVLRFSDKITSVPGEEALYPPQHSAVNCWRFVSDRVLGEQVARRPTHFRRLSARRRSRAAAGRGTSLFRKRRQSPGAVPSIAVRRPRRRPARRGAEWPACGTAGHRSSR